MDPLLLSPLQKGPHVFGLRQKMGRLELFVNSLEFSSVTSKLARTVAGLPIFCDSEDSDNDTTLNDEDMWLNSPTQKRKLLISPEQAPSALLFPDTKPSPEPTSNLDAQNPYFSSNDHLSKTSLQSFSVPHDVIPRIDVGELHKIVTAQYANQFEKLVVVDCRFPYEYAGGHIENAVNISLQTQLEEHFMLSKPAPNHKTLLVFHCEYSLLRGPTMALHLRKLDRLHNADSYPYLTYPDIVVLEGGYKSFFDKYMHLCEPQGYVEMKDTKHKRVCEVEMNKVLQALKLIRAKSFNIVKPRLPLTHTRSASLTSTLSSFESQTAHPPVLRRSRLNKVHKRDKRDSRPLFTQSLYNLTQNPESSISSFPLEANDDLAPPPMVFADLDKSLSALLLSVQLPSESVYSVTTFSSTDSLMDVNSPFTDALDDFDFAPSSISLKHSTTAGPNGFARPKLSLARTNTRTSYVPLLLSPSMSLPFFATGSGVDDLSDESFQTADPF